jgi:hypothetical protein
MAKNESTQSKPPAQSTNAVWIVIGIIALLAAVGIVYVITSSDKTPAANVNLRTSPATTPPTVATTNANVAPPQPAPTPTPPTGNPEVSTMDVAKAVMVTVEEDFGKGATVASAIKQVERRFKPDDGVGRTFAVLDAYGETMPDGRVHMSMHVSSEKPGMGQLVHKQTGKVLWDAKINPVSSPPSPKALRIIVEPTPGNGFNVDVKSADNILGATASGKGVPVGSVWPDGAEMEVTFIYSMCGCPVKAMVKRVGDKTMRTKDLPVMFPDDPDALQTIAKFMRWAK